MRAPHPAPGRREQRGAWAIVALLTLIGLGLRWPSFGESLFGDELSAFYIVAGHSFGTMMHLLNGHSTELNPPLFFMLTWVSTKVFGLSAESLKLLSLLVGVSTIPLLYILGRQVFGTLTGLVAAALGATSPFLIYYSTEARPYALMLWLVLVATLALLRAVRGGGRTWWTIYAVAVCAAAYTHFTSVFALAVLFLWALVTQPQARRPLVLATAVAVVGYLPELPVLNRISQSPGTSIYGSIDPLTLHSAHIDLGRWAIGHPYLPLSQVPGTVAALLIAAAVALALVGVALRLRSPTERRLALRPGAPGLLILILAGAAPVGAALYTIVHQSVWGARNVISSWSAFAVVLAALVTLAGTRLRALPILLLVGGFALGGISMLSSSVHRPDYADAVAFLNRVDPRRGPVAELPAPTPGPPTETEAALDLAGISRQHPVFRIGRPTLAQVLAAPPYRALIPPRGETIASQAAAAAGNGTLFLVGPISTPIVTLQDVRRRHLHSTNGNLGYLVSFLGALPARFHPVGARTFPGLLPVTVYVYRG
jgi:4-amino-4-deoxy-L-arabinose transferase-like glycosyltransferase